MPSPSLHITYLKIGHDQVLRAFWNSFEQEFKPDIDAIQRYSDYVQREITLAKAQADRQDQQLQAREREEALQSRRGLNSFFSQNTTQLAEIREWEVQRHERQRRQYLRCKPISFLTS